MLFIGIGIFIAINIGVDPVTGVNMLVKDKTKLQYKTAKIICDLTSLIIGFSLGGKAGVVTIITAFIAGPVIQKISETFDKKILKKMNLNNYSN